LSGVLKHQAEEVMDVYRKTDPQIRMSVWQEENGWVCITGQRA
jgi:ribosomal protein L11 methylase PrmA